MVQRELTGHEVEGLTPKMRICVMDTPQANGACHRYRIERGDQSQVAFVNFHEGEIVDDADADADVDGNNANGNDANGLTDEALLVILADRMRAFEVAANPATRKVYLSARKNIEEAMEALRKKSKKKEEKPLADAPVA